MTVAKAHGLYMEAMRRGDRRQLKPTVSHEDAIFVRDIKPRLGAIILDELTEEGCWDAVYDKAQTSKDRANKMAGELCCFLKRSSGREDQMSGIRMPAHPAPTLNSNWFDTGSKANQRFLSDDELNGFSHRLASTSRSCRAGSRLAILKLRTAKVECRLGVMAVRSAAAHGPLADVNCDLGQAPKAQVDFSRFLKYHPFFLGAVITGSTINCVKDRVARLTGHTTCLGGRMP
jgi:hypothetical protein